MLDMGIKIPEYGDIGAAGDRIAEILRRSAQSQQAGPTFEQQVDALGRMRSAGFNPTGSNPVDVYDERINHFKTVGREANSAELGAAETAYNQLLKMRELGNAEVDRVLKYASDIAGEDAPTLIDALEERYPDIDINASNFHTYAVPVARELGIPAGGHSKALDMEAKRSLIQTRNSVFSEGQREDQSKGATDAIVNQILNEVLAPPPDATQPPAPDISGGGGVSSFGGGEKNDTLSANISPEKMKKLRLAAALTEDPRLLNIVKAVDEEQKAIGEREKAADKESKIELREEAALSDLAAMEERAREILERGPSMPELGIEGQKRSWYNPLTTDLERTTGFDSTFYTISGTGPSDVEADIEYLTGRSALEAIKELKEFSDKGSTGFGSITEKELALLENSIANLKSKDQSDEEYQKEVARVFKKAREMRERVLKAREMREGASPNSFDGWSIRKM